MYEPTELCLIAEKYGADKCPQINHCYTPFYYEFFKDKRDSIKKVFEMGVGSFRQFKFIKNYTLGASLYMWRDFFPNANVYGGDIEPSSVFKTDRIETFYCDACNKDDLEHLVMQIGANFDIFVDDASHHIDDQVFLFKFFMPLLPKHGIYIIEDMYRPNKFMRWFSSQYDCFEPTLIPNRRKRVRGEHIVVVRHKA